MKLIRTFLWVALVSSLATHSAHGAALQWGGDGPVLKDRDGNLLPGSASPVDSGFIQLIEDVDGGGIDFDAGQPDGLPSSSSDAVRATSHVGKDVWLYADGWFSGDMYNNAQSGQVFYVRFFEQPSPDYAAGVIPSTGRYGQTTNPYTMGRLPIETWLITEIMRATFPDPITDPPTAPDTLAASALSASEIGVTWTDRSSNEDGFTLDRRESGTSAWVTVLSSGPDVEAFTDTVLAPATKYYYKVKAYNTDGESAYSNVGSATTDELPPTAPSALAAVALSTTEIKVTWNDTSSNEEGFRVRWSIDDFATSTAVELAADTTSYRHTGLNPDTTYYYKVKARHDTLGDSAYTPTVSEATPPDTALNTVEVRVNAGTDDAEERLADNSMYLNSSDLELTFESGGGGLDQAVGMRFTGVGIPQGATILNAYVQFQVDEVTTGPVALTIQGQNTDNAATFGAASADISSRPATAASVAWSPAAWDTVGAAGSAQRTPDLSTVLQEIVNRSGWASGNALAIIVTGSGKRTAEAFEGDPTGAALLHVEYSTSAGVVDARVASGNDDAEERLADNNMYLNSSDLELTEDGTGSQLIGMRFTGLAIPQGATIVNAHLQFKVDEITTGAVDLTIRGQAADNAAVFSSAAGNISSRALTATSVAWSPSDWTTVGESGAAQRTPDLAAVVQEIVSRAGWVSGNALAMIVSGTGRRTAESFNGDSAGAPLLHVEFSTGAEQLDLQVAAGTDDAEERLDDNSMYLNSSDLELAFESYGSGQDQAVGMRFTGVTVPQGATIVAAHLRFQVDEISTGAAALTIEGQAADNAATFTAASADISGRAKTASSVVWNPPDWGTVGEAGADQQTPDIAAVIQDIVSRPGWAAGNALAIVISGSGKRTAEAFEGDSAGAPVLHIEYVPGQVEPPAAFTAYNDLAWLAGQTTAKITTYTSPNDGGSLPASGALVDYDTGQTLGATLTVAGGDGIQSYGKHPASGTDAYGVFNGVVNCDGQLSYNATDDLVLTFAGLDPSLAYELVLYCDRSGNNYVDANSRYQVATLSGADGFVNQSTAGTEILTSAVADDTTKYNAGLNRLNGYVTRFVNIDPGSDGEIVLTVDRDSALMHYTYANAVMLKATPKSVQNFVAYNDLAWLSGQATAKITTYTTPSNSDGLPTSGALVDYNSGTTLGATLTVEGGGGGVQSYGQHPASGTDAYGVFNGVVDCDGQIGYSAADDLVLTFAGLDPSMAYELVLYCDRSGNNYVDANSRYQVATLSGADGFVNQSTAGTEILTSAVADDTTKYNAGLNRPDGYVTRFVNIDPGSDGEIVLTVDRDSALMHYTYANAVMLKATPKSVQNFVAYNDLAWLSGQATAKITTYTTPSNSDGLPTSGALVDYNSGTTLGATLTVEGGGGGVQSYGQHPASGTDAYGVFNGVVDCDGQIGYSAADDLVLTFAGLDPSMAYELVLYCDRSGNNYVGADSRYQVATLSGADAFVNQSTAGTEILTTTAANDTTKYNAGYNTQNGYVTRFIDIDPGSDGRIVLTVDRDSALKYYTYANAVMLKSKAATAAAASSPSIAAAEPTEITASWGMAYFGTASVDPDADPDGDSASNREEWIAGTDPTDETSWFWLDIVSSLDEVIVSMDTIEVLDAEMFAGYGRCYTIEQKIGEDGEWTPIPGFHKRAASGGPAVYVLPGEEIAEPRFYRAKVCLDVD